MVIQPLEDTSKNFMSERTDARIEVLDGRHDRCLAGEGGIA